MIGGGGVMRFLMGKGKGRKMSGVGKGEGGWKEREEWI